MAYPLRGSRKTRAAAAAFTPAAAFTAAALWWGPAAAAHARPLARVMGVACRLEHGDGVALTFDDGPHPAGTPQVLETLGRYGARATFFLVGEQVERFPMLVDEIVAGGHEVAVHGYRHRNQMRLLARTVAADTERSIAVIAEASGGSPRLYRPPYGAFTPAGLLIARRLGLVPLLWSRWGRDWRATTSAAQIAKLSTRRIGARDVVLLHDADWYGSSGSYANTVAALPAILEELGRRGLRPVTAGEGLGAAEQASLAPSPGSAGQPAAPKGAGQPAA